MLQNDPIRNLQYDSEIRVAQSQQTHLEPRVFDGPQHIISQPQAAEAVRIPLPTIDQNLSGSRTLIPHQGYEFLRDVPSIHIEQTFELNDTLTSVNSENRYIIRSALGDAIFSASESSNENNRLIWGNSRPFQLHLLDRTHQEALLLRKKFALGAMCCQPKTLEVWVPPGNVLGRIVQSPTLCSPLYFIEDSNTNEPVFCVEGPDHMGVCCLFAPKEAFFRVHSGGTMRASIEHKWEANKSQYTTNIYFSDSKMTAKERALILGAAFLLEYIYFQK